MSEIIIIGAGIGGCYAALELANAGYKVILIEKKGELLSGSSDDAPCRLGLGFHYIDIDTAKMYLRATINVLKQYPHFVIAEDKPVTHHCRRGRYFVVKDSQFELDQIYQLHRELRQEYVRLVKEDPSNEVVGPPDIFTQVLPVSDYQDNINADLVVAAFETAEQTLDWPKFKKHLVQLIESNENIRVYKNTEVTNATHNETGGFEISTITKLQDNSTHRQFKTDYVVNASWENIEEINATAGFVMSPRDTRTNRTKALAYVQLPKTLEKINSMFFCFGPHCSLTNIGNGYAYISYEPVTNVEATTDLHVSAFSKRLLDDGATQEEKMQYGQKILDGVAYYIPAMKDAKIIDTRFGNVRTLGEVDIYSSNSDFHRRNHLAIKEQQIGWIDFPCMKLFYFQEGTSLVKKMLELHIQADQFINEIAQTYVKTNHCHDKASLPIIGYLRKNFSAAELVSKPNISNWLEQIIPTTWSETSEYAEN